MFAGINLPEQPYAMFSVDQLAPQVTVTNISGIDPVSWYPESKVIQDYCQ
jgi:hypothetical protein